MRPSHPAKETPTREARSPPDGTSTAPHPLLGNGGEGREFLCILRAAFSKNPEAARGRTESQCARKRSRRPLPGRRGQRTWHPRPGRGGVGDGGRGRGAAGPPSRPSSAQAQAREVRRRPGGAALLPVAAQALVPESAAGGAAALGRERPGRTGRARECHAGGPGRPLPTVAEAGAAAAAAAAIVAVQPDSAPG